MLALPLFFFFFHIAHGCFYIYGMMVTVNAYFIHKIAYISIVWGRILNQLLGFINFSCKSCVEIQDNRIYGMTDVSLISHWIKCYVYIFHYIKHTHIDEKFSTVTGGASEYCLYLISRLIEQLRRAAPSCLL